VRGGLRPAGLGFGSVWWTVPLNDGLKRRPGWNGLGPIGGAAYRWPQTPAGLELVPVGPEGGGRAGRDIGSW
ncbi:hypothetical protein ACWIGN_15450, partial [Streptomyces albidoflavus]